MKKSIKRLPKRTQEELTVLLDLVRKSIGNCQMVILFGSYARGNYVLWDSNIEFGVHTSYQSDYDILVITNGAVKRAERKLERITNKYHDLFEYRLHAFPQFIVEHINTVNNNLEVSQYFFTDIVKEGKAVIMVSSELPELIGMCDRIYIMCQGKISGCINRNEFSQETIMKFATGLKNN